MSLLTTSRTPGSRRPAVLALAAGLITVLVVVGMVWPTEREPEYQGKKLSEWLKPKGAVTIGIRSREGARAVRRIGTNALPYLVQWLRYERPAWREKLSAAYGKLPRILVNDSIKNRILIGKRERRALAAIEGFFILGHEGAPAVPELIRLVNATNAPRCSGRAILCLVAIGKDARPAVPDIVRLYRLDPTNASLAVRQIESSHIESVALESARRAKAEFSKKRYSRTNEATGEQGSYQNH
jgi:hypothetical protein